MKKCFFFLIIFILSGFVHLNAQTDTEFWFGAPDITDNHDSGFLGIKFQLTTLGLPADIKIYQPQNGAFTPVTDVIPANSTREYTIPWNSIEHLFADADNVVPKGIKIEASNKISAYYEVTTRNNPDLFSLKGKNALGYEFYIPAQDDYDASYSNAHNGFIIAATEDNTTVTITPTNNIFYGHGAGTPYTVNMNSGYTYSAVAAGNDASEHLGGTRIVSDEPIAVTIYDDSATPPYDGCRDLMGDQLIPVIGIDENYQPGDTLIGKEYILMKGQLGAGGRDAVDKVYVFAVEDDTEVEIDNIGNPGIELTETIDAGQLSKDTLRTPFTYVKADKPVYVVHISGFGCEMGQAVLPDVERCTGSTQVGFTRSLDNFMGDYYSFYLNIMVRDGAQDGFILNGGAVNTDISDADFQKIPGTQWWAASIPFNEVEIPAGSPNLIENIDDVFHLGIINGNAGGGCRYGYFSDFNEVEAESIIADSYSATSAVRCFGEPVQLVASGGTNYEWEPQTYLDDPYIATPTFDGPAGLYNFEVFTTGACNQKDSSTTTVFVSPEVTADYTISKVQGCSPVEITFKDYTTGVNEFYFDYDNDGSADSTIKPLPPANDHHFNEFTKTFYNNSDTTKIYEIELLTRNTNDCPDTLTRTLVVQPFIDAAFQPDTAGCNPLGVQFRNYTTGGNMDSTTYTWEFGDGNSSYDSLPYHNFVNPTGTDTTYTTEMIAESKFGCYDTISHDITVFPFIKASFTLDTIQGCSPLTVDADGLSYPGISNYQWYYGDGHQPSGPGLNDPAPHTYTNLSGTPDTNMVKLVVQNIHGCKDSLMRQVIIYPEVTAEFDPLVPPVTGCNPVTVDFTNESVFSTQSFSTGITYTWDFGDGNTSIAEDPTHVFNNPSYQDTTYTVNLTATSPNGCFHDTSTTVEVYSYIKADFSVSNVQGCSPLTVEIDDTSKGIVDHYWFWDAENNPTIGSHDSLNPGNSFTKTYVNRTGLIQEKYLTLVIENSQNCRDTLHRKITIYPEVTAEFTPLNQAGCNPFTVDFTNQSHYTDTTSDNGLAYNWDFGDGGSSNQAGPIHVFNNTLPTDTNYTVKMTVTSPNGCLDSTETNVSVYDYIKADFSVSNPVGCAPYTITIDEYSSGGVDSYEWYWDDDYTSVDSANVTGTFTHTYQNTTTSPVNYTLTLVVENNNNCTDTLRRNITVYPQVIADFTPTLTEGCHPVSVHFNNTTTITNPPNYTWNFGDGGSSNLEEPDHTFYNFSNTGDSTYTVELIAVSDYYCADTTTRTIDVYHNPKAQIDINQTEDCPPLEIIANNTSTGADSYEWHFGDGDVENYNNPVTVNHSYDNTTSDVESFTLKLITETTNNCLDSTQLQLSVYPRVEAEFDVVGGNWAGCHPFSVQFVDSSENANYYYWDFKDGVTSNLQNPVNRFENTTQTNKDYEVFLRATSDFDCVDSIDHTITVYPSPTAAFAVTPTLQIFPNATVSIDNNTNQGPWNYSWTFGDGQSSNQDEPGLHTYQTWGEYEISLLAQSANCEDSVDHSISIIPPEPQAAFQMSPQEGCEPLTVQFTDNSLYAEDYYWDFDDGSPVSNEVNPTHTFTEAGTYYVKQTIEGEGGEDYAYNTIRVYQKPEADFTVEPKLVMLPDQEIHCYNLSKYEHYYLWNFGDGATANEEDPIHLYRDEGIYDIRLEIETIEGCKDTLVKHDIVEVVGQGELEFPDAFTPSKSGPSNGEWKENDLSNDIFHPIGKGVVEYKLYIYNKWGEQLFMSDDFKIGWDGYYNGELMPQDVYIWKAEGKFSNGKTFERMGNVTLLR